MDSDSDVNFFRPLMTIQPVDLPERSVRHVRVKDANELYHMYYFKDELGQGTFGRVVEVTEKSTLKTWAMKIVLKAKMERWKELQNEIKILKFVNHPHIIYLDSIYETSKKMYLVFEKCGCTLQAVFEERNPLTEKSVKTIIQDLSDSVYYLHKHNIVHRDIKMQNILMAKNEKDPNDENYIKLTDFGLSIVKSGRGVDNMMKQFCGTLYYMPPEILEKKAYSELCDVWSIGIILYILLYGRKPFRGSSEREVITMILNEEPNYVADKQKVSEKARHLIQAMLTKSPTNRITAALILDHPWLSKKKVNQNLPNYNVLDMMSQWKDEMQVESSVGKDADWEINDLNPTARKASDTIVIRSNLKSSPTMDRL